MLIVAVGVNHRTAPIEVREKLSFSTHTLPVYLQQLYAYPGINGCVLISTCNRTEIYVTCNQLEDGLNGISDFLCDYSHLELTEIKKYTFSFTVDEAVKHLFIVSAGLDSMILGETQILGQLRDAYQIALKTETTNVVINNLFQQAIIVGKRVRTETGIDKNAVSVSYAAVELVKQKFDDLCGRSVLIIGAGKMSELTAKHLVANGVTGVIVSNRSYDRAVVLAKQFNGKAVKFEELYHYMLEADIIISSTAATHYVIRYQDMAKITVKNQNKKRMIIDIAVPRDVDPKVGELPEIILYDIDDLKNVVDNNFSERRLAAKEAEKIIAEELSVFEHWLLERQVVPTITALMEMGDEIREHELKKALGRLGDISDKETKIIKTLAHTIVKQLLHLPVINLKKQAVAGNGELYNEIMKKMFDLNLSNYDKVRNYHMLELSEKQREKVASIEKHSGRCQN